jgi:hypothetical protein
MDQQTKIRMETSWESKTIIGTSTDIHPQIEPGYKIRPEQVLEAKFDENLLPLSDIGRIIKEYQEVPDDSIDVCGIYFGSFPDPLFIVSKNGK